MPQTQDLLIQRYNLLINLSGFLLSNTQRMCEYLGTLLTLFKFHTMRYDRLLQRFMPHFSLFHTSYVLFNLRFEVLRLCLLHLQLLAERLRFLSLHGQRGARFAQFILLAAIDDGTLLYLSL